MGSLKQTPFTRIEEVAFRVYTDEEIEKLSAITIFNETSINSLGHYLDHGIYDLHMGPMTSDDPECKTCRNKFFACSGHCGHIDLPVPVCNPFFYDVIRDLVSRICPSCYFFQVKASRAIQFVYEHMLTAAGYDLQSLDISNIVSNFLSEPDEAIEQPTEEEIPHTQDENSQIILSLKKKLKKFMKDTKKGIQPSKSPTSTSQATYIHLQKKFLSDTSVKSVNAVCMYCKENLLIVKIQNCQIHLKNADCPSKNEKEKSVTNLVSESQPYLTPKQAQMILRNCFKRDGIILKTLYPFLESCTLPHPTDMFFIQKLIVIPPKFRPMNYLRGTAVEMEISFLYKSVLRLTKCLRFLGQYKDKEDLEIPEAIQFLVQEFKGRTVMEKTHTIWHQLQGTIDNILDSELCPPSFRLSHRGIRQMVEKKFGLFRRNLMGKRVDFSARSVAAPDPMLAVDEVGVPQDFALKLTYPVPVTPWNVPKLRTLVENGPLNYPGALVVEDEEGKKITLKPDDMSQRSAIAKALLTPTESCVKKKNATKIVYRHLLSGDYVLMNRQPTLHKSSIQAHKARIMAKDRVLRLPYASCKAYNADFDGDELNMHFPQNEMARSEACYVVTTHNQYLTSKDGSPLAGLIQDCVVASVMLTMRGKFFSMEDYQQLVFIAVGDVPRKIHLLPPAILRPERLWSGKQIISTILHNLIPKKLAKPTFIFRTSVKVDLWNQREPRPWRGGGTPEARKESMTESEFILRDGELLCGVVDKCAIGSTSYGLVHTCHELYGGSVSSKVLTAINRLCVIYLQWAGHTISLQEFVTPSYAAKNRRKELQNLIEEAEREVTQKLGLKGGELPRHLQFLHNTANEKEMSAVDAAYTSVLGPVTSSVTSENEKNLYRNNLKNRMRMMVDTGAKGSKVNMNQMASLFGSVAIDGKRMPMSVTGKTLPSFKPYECNPRAGGYIPNRFVTGMDPQSYFFLCIVGRDSLQHTAVKTANSGYMQRCLIKHLEGIRVKYDMTVRNSDDLVLQFEYGEDGLDVSKVPFLRDMNTLDSLLNYYNKDVNQKDLDIIALTPKSHQIDQFKKWVKKYKHKWKKTNRNSGFLRFCKEQNVSADASKFDYSCGRPDAALVLAERWHRMSREQKEKYQSLEGKLKRGRNTVSSMFCGSSHIGVVSEALDSLIDEYYDSKYSARRPEEQPLSKNRVTTALHMKALKSRVDPGEAVGALCAQAIGEPLTQMTLNTFHFAGRDELNVTLGVPRMIEILRTASEKIATPIMEVPFKAHVSASLAERLRLKLTPVPLEKVMNKVLLTASLERAGTKLIRRVELRFTFLPHKEYRKTYFVRPKEVLSFMERVFFKAVLIRAVKVAMGKAKTFGASSNKSRSEKDEDEVEGDGELTEGAATRPVEDEDSDSEAEEESPDQVADTGVSSSSREQKRRERDYSEDEDEEGEIDNLVKAEVGYEEEEEEGRTANRKLRRRLEDIMASDEEEEMEEQPEEPTEDLESTGCGPIKQEEEASAPKKTPKKKTKAKSSGAPENEATIRRNVVISQDPWISDYDFDEEENLWCSITLHLPLAEGRYDLASILQSAAQTTLVHSMRNIKKAFVVQKENHLLLRTEGVNIQKICTYENLLDINCLYTNNIHFMAQMYGIEAAQRCIIKEIRAVQSAYDIKVDFRHLSLLADYFTCEGVYKACSRFALNTCSSPIQKMSYETCFQFLKKALLQGMPDPMCSPSANVMVGQPVKVGTNSMDILSKLSVNAY